MGPKTTDEFGKVPSAFDYVKTDEDRKVLEIHFKQTILGRPLAAPPGMPKERLAALRKALLDTMKDREFLAEAERANLDVDPATAEQVEQLLKQFADYPEDGGREGASRDRTMIKRKPSRAIARTVTLRCALLRASKGDGR